MGDDRSRDTVRLTSSQFDDLKNSAHDLRNLTSQINHSIDGKVMQALSDANTSGIAEQLAAIRQTIEDGFKLVADRLEKLQPPAQPKRLEIIMSFVVKDDNPDVAYSLTIGEVKDAEGNVIPDASLDITVEGDAPDVVAVTPGADPKAGMVHFGNPGNATITANVSSGGTLLGSGVAGFVVTTGNPASVSGVTLAFEGLTETP